jgi:hydroxymethylglutaryl-CoA lyase
MSDLPKAIVIGEEGPREGFQIEKGAIPTARKIALIDALSLTGLREIQVVSFVPAKNVPGMADAEEVVAGIAVRPDVRFTGLWLNEAGLHRALRCDKLTMRGGIGLTASPAFLKRNQNRGMDDNLRAQRRMAGIYRELGIPVRRATIMAAFGCNFEGEIAPARVVALVGQLLEIAREAGVTLDELVLADTMAWATPIAIERLVGDVRAAYPQIPIRLHLHDTRGMGVANAYAGLRMGVTRFDTAVAGLGGCPFAAHKGASGNLCTEDLVFMCHEMGIATGVDLDALIEAAHLAEDVVGHPLPGSVKSGGSLAAYRRHAA